MPVNSSHAFAQGGLYPLRPYKAGLLPRLLGRLGAECPSVGRQRVVEQFLGNAVVGRNCRVGVNAWCMNFGPKEGLSLGDHSICRGVLTCERFNPGRLAIADHVYIGDDCIISCAENVEIGPYTLLAHGVQIFDSNSHPIGRAERKRDILRVMGLEKGGRTDIAAAPVRLGSLVWVGMNSLIMKGVTLGDNCVVAAGSVVTSDLPPNCIAAGNPARVVS